MGLGYIKQQSMPDVDNGFLMPKQKPAQFSFAENSADDAWTEALICALTLSQVEVFDSKSLSPLQALALSVVRQSLIDAARGDYDALWWLLTEGRVWLDELGISSWIVAVSYTHLTLPTKRIV